jgi:hypothetical protein
MTSVLEEQKWTVSESSPLYAYFAQLLIHSDAYIIFVVLSIRRKQRVARDQSAWAFERARAAALFLEASMETGS